MPATDTLLAMDPSTSCAGSQEASTSAAQQAPTQQASDQPSKQVEVDKKEASSSQPTASVSPSLLLPIELLVEILRYLSTSDAARSARVSSVWHAASKDSRIWRHLSFTRFNLPDSARALQEEQIRSFSARCGNTVESVDFANLSRKASHLLAQDLTASAHTLKFIRSAPAVSLYRCNGATSVATLAERCPALDTLELYGVTHARLDFPYYVGEEESWEEVKISRPRNVKLSLYSSIDHLLETGILHHATTLEIKPASGLDEDEDDYCKKSMFALSLHQLFTANPVIERLTVHGLSEEYSIVLPSAVTAPSLTFLDLSYSHESVARLEIVAPKLSELIIDGRCLPRLSLESMATLSALTLRVVETSNDQETKEFDHIDRIRYHRGSLKLVVGEKYAEQVLALLSRGFRWPGLVEVDIKIERSSLSLLVSVIIARQAGTLGVSSDQYIEMARKAGNILQNALVWSNSAFIAQAKEALATTSAFANGTDTPSLCSSVKWRLTETSFNAVARTILDWLEQQPDITVARA